MKYFSITEFRLLRNIILILTVSVTALFLLSSSTLTAKEAYQKKTVTTKSGLNLRETADSAGKKKGVIPFGETVEITETNPAEVTIAGKTGHWVKVKWKNLDGWAFDAFLGEAGSSSLLDHFKAIAIEMQGDNGCSFTKTAGWIFITCYCNDSEQSIEAYVRDESVIFEHTASKCTSWKGNAKDDESCTAAQTTYYECVIESRKILATKAGETLKTDVACKVMKTIEER